MISPLARDRDSKAAAGLNVNGDDAAAAIAAALKADELLFLADVEGVLEDGKIVKRLDRAAVDDLTAREVVAGGMRAKLEAALVALDAGVRTVRIGSIDAIADPAQGSLLVLPTPAAQRSP